VSVTHHNGPDEPVGDHSGQGVERQLPVTRGCPLRLSPAPVNPSLSPHRPLRCWPDQPNPPSAGDLISTHSLSPPSSCRTTRTRHATRAPEREPGRVFGLALDRLRCRSNELDVCFPHCFFGWPALSHSHPGYRGVSITKQRTTQRSTRTGRSTARLQALSLFFSPRIYPERRSLRSHLSCPLRCSTQHPIPRPLSLPQTT
jgi:hypothetical protein